MGLKSVQKKIVPFVASVGALMLILPGIHANKPDEDSNSSVKFASEVWGHFEVEGDSATCTICQKSTENSVDEMKNHLEEEHPAVMIDILKKPDDEATDDDTPQNDNLSRDTFTEVVYLEEEPMSKRYKQRLKKRPKVTQHSFTEEKSFETPRIEYKVIPHAPETQHGPEIEAFLNYVGCLLKNVPKDRFPKLQLEIISLIVNAQMSQPTNIVATPSVGSHVEIPGSIAISTVNSTEDYRFNIAGKESDNQ